LIAVEEVGVLLPPELLLQALNKNKIMIAKTSQEETFLTVDIYKISLVKMIPCIDK